MSARSFFLTSLLLASIAAAPTAATAKQGGGSFGYGSNGYMLNDHLGYGTTVDRPTGFGRPGEYWGLPTGSHIDRRSRRTVTAKATTAAAIAPPAHAAEGSQPASSVATPASTPR